MPPSSNSNVDFELTFKYLDLGAVGGRGGIQRFFMLANNIPFIEQLYDFSDPASWGVEKQRLLDTNENPCGSVPVTILQTTNNNHHKKVMNDHKKQKKEEDITTTTTTTTTKGVDDSDLCLHLSQHVSTCRYLARLYQKDMGDNNSNAYQEYVQDLVAEEYQGFRAQWVEYSFYNNDDKAKENYRTTILPKQLIKFEALYQKYKAAVQQDSSSSSSSTTTVTQSLYPPFLSTTQNPLWGDSAMFGILYDHIQFQYMTEESLYAGDYPHLAALYKAFATIPAVATWIEEKHKKANIGTKKANIGTE